MKKELLIILLLIVVIVFVLIVLLYDFIPGKKENIKSVEYIAENSVSDVLEEIKENTGVDVQARDSDIPLKSYSVDANDLNVYASENSYESGKSDPFAENASKVETTLKTTTENAKEPEKKVQSDSKTEKPENTVKNDVTEKKDTKPANEANNNIVSIVPQAKPAEDSGKGNTTSSEGVFFEKKDSK